MNKSIIVPTTLVHFGDWKVVKYPWWGVRVLHGDYVDWPILLPSGKLGFAVGGKDEVVPWQSTPDINTVAPPELRHWLYQYFTKGTTS